MTQRVVRERAAETVEPPSGAVFRLLVDGGAAGVNRLTLPAGADGAKPHRHLRSTELFYVLDGALEVLLGTEVVTVTAGDLAVVPPGMPHAFRAAPGREADLLAVLTPGVERFGYFRALGRIARGEDRWENLLPRQREFDVHFTAGNW
ncbi:cupin domain-containing protein [Streptomyces sp. NPDC093546]|uniref:cupin domain-containing protein n=1 Tax=Streptomyces sp. NPDC093546 TaxID=3366040 RepID=UPI003814F4C0